MACVRGRYMEVGEEDVDLSKEEESLLEEQSSHPRHSKRFNFTNRRFTSLIRSRKLPLRLLIFITLLVILPLLLFAQFPDSVDQVKSSIYGTISGQAEVPGVKQASARLKVLQQKLERKYLEDEVVIKNLGEKYDLDAYHARLRGYYEKFFAPDKSSSQSSIWSGVEAHLMLSRQPSKEDLQQIPHLVTSSAKNASDLPDAFKLWQEHQSGWQSKVYNDNDIDQFTRDSFLAMRRQPAAAAATETNSTESVDIAKHSSDFYLQWRHLPYPILRIDTFRYLKVFLDGGAYGDSDTGSFYPIKDWPGINGPHPKVVAMLDKCLELLEMQPWLKAESPRSEEMIKNGNLTQETTFWNQPDLVVAIEYDAPGKKKLWKELKLARPLQITQFAFLAKPYHPVLLDCLGTIMEYASRYHANLTATEGNEFMNLILDWIGPGLFTDAVYRYLVARYGVDPFSFAGLDDKAARIGDVLIYPEFAFGIDKGHHLSKDFELVYHGFLHRWIDNFYNQASKRRLQS